MTQKEFQEKLEDLYKKYTEAHAVDLEKIPVEMMLDKNYLRNYTIFSYAKIGEEIDKLIKDNPEFKPDYSFWTGKELQKRCLELDKQIEDKIEQYHISLIKEPRPENKIRTVDEFNVDGDIIITDPCYIRKYINPEHSRSTIYGDWSCAVWQCKKDQDPEPNAKSFGEFCADSGMVCVTNIKGCENRDKIEQWVKDHKWCATIINNFKGKVKYIIRRVYFPYKKNWDYGDMLHIRGDGIKDGKDFSFITSQTDF